MEEWIEEELEGVRLGDERLHQRLGRMLEKMGKRPVSSLPEACGDWGELLGAYRFFANAKVSLSGVISGHREATVGRMRGEKVVLCVQDTTFLSFGDCRETEGLGPHTHGHEHGLSLHPVVAVSPSGECLGTLWAKSWAKDQALEGKKTYKKRPVKERESWRWVEGLEAVNALPEDLPMRVVVADREADIYRLMSQPRRAGVHWLVRAMHNRITSQKEKMLEVLADTEALGEVELTVPRRRNVPSRTARMEIKATRVEIQVAKRSKAEGSKLEISVIRAREIDPGKDPLDWILLTDLPVTTLAEALEKVQWYRCRWKIEELFHVLKSGCQVERLQLESRQRLEAAVGVYLMVAWRLMQLKEQSRRYPDKDSSLLLSRQEWQTLAKLNKQPTAQPPTLENAVTWIAKLGGYLNRKNDPPPGIKTLWKGLRRLQDIILGAALADNCV